MSKRTVQTIPAPYLKLVQLNRRLILLEMNQKFTLTRDSSWKICWKVPRKMVSSEVYPLHAGLRVDSHKYKVLSKQWISSADSHDTIKIIGKQEIFL